MGVGTGKVTNHAALDLLYSVVAILSNINYVFVLAPEKEKKTFNTRIGTMICEQVIKTKNETRNYLDIL